MPVGRRGYLAALAGGVGPVAGCSSAEPTDDERITPAPVPEERSTPTLAPGEIHPARVGDAHVEALSGTAATVGIESIVREGGRPTEVRRLRVTLDGTAFTYRRLLRRTLAIGTVTESFRGVWYDDGEAILRIVDGGRNGVYRETADYTPAPAADRVDRDRLVDVLAGFDPRKSPADEGVELLADGVSRPERLSRNGVSAGDAGRLTGRLSPSGVLTELDAEYAASTSGGRATVAYGLAVSELGSTTVKRPTARETAEWYDTLSNRSPLLGGE